MIIFCRKYALRRIRDGFKENKNLTDSVVIESEIKEAQSNLQIIKRQVTFNFSLLFDKN